MDGWSHHHAESTHDDQCDAPCAGGLGCDGRDGFILTDPVILSRTRSFGVTDLGPTGMSTFFARHKCSAHCKPSWLKPQDLTTYFKASAGTSMMM